MGDAASTAAALVSLMLSPPTLLLAALLLDAAFGEPVWLWSRLPHPAVLMGRAVSSLDRALNHGGDLRRRAMGAVAALILIVGAAAAGWILASIPVIGPVLEILGAAILLAQRSLVDHVAAVATGLRRGLAEGRRAVSMIVGRDPEALGEAGVARAAIESAAENFSDGVIAPAFWFLVGGLPGIAAYKALNTADSMIGHRTPRHEAFGWAAARLDDAANWIPARLSGALIAATALSPRAFRVMLRDAGLHRSPNAGWPEAATASVLDVALAGPRAYGGVMGDDPYVHPEGRREIGAEEVDAAVRLLWRSWALALLLLLLGALVLR